MKNIADIQQEGYIQFNVPGVEHVFEVQATDVEAESKQHYTWQGEFINGVGTLTMVYRDGKTRAHFTFEDEAYEIYPLDEELHAVAKIKTHTYTGKECSEPDHGKAASAPLSEEGARVIACNQRRTRILALFTNRAIFAVGNVFPEIELAVAQYNNAINRSQVNSTAQVELAGMLFINFVETNSIADDVNRLANNTPEAQRLREDHDADIVVLFTDAEYDDSDTWGRVQAIGPNEADAYAIVELEEASARKVLAHEIGHLFGGRHQTCAEANPCVNFGLLCCDDGGPAIAHGYNFTRRRWPAADRRYRTIMHVWDDRQPVDNFSNPNVTYDQRATGNVNTANNALIFSQNAQQIANFDRDDAAFTVGIDGPTFLNPYETGTWEAIMSCGNALILTNGPLAQMGSTIPM